MKRMFLVVWIIVELALFTMIIMPWFDTHLWVSTKITMTASATTVGAMLTFACYMINRSIKKLEE